MRDARVTGVAGLVWMVVAAMGQPAGAQGRASLPPAIEVAPAPRVDASHTADAAGGRTPTVPKTWSRVRLTDPLAAHATRRALERARTLLARPACAAILTEFEDHAGRPLAERVSALGVDAQTYLEFVVFIDGTRHRQCGTGTIGFTVPGSRVVRLCTDELKRIGQPRFDHLVGSFIHEVLHTLGLPENPPSSHEITRRVLDRCGAQ